MHSLWSVALSCKAGHVLFRVYEGVFCVGSAQIQYSAHNQDFLAGWYYVYMQIDILFLIAIAMFACFGHWNTCPEHYVISLTASQLLYCTTWSTQHSAVLVSSFKEGKCMLLLSSKSPVRTGRRCWPYWHKLLRADMQAVPNCIDCTCGSDQH